MKIRNIYFGEEEYQILSNLSKQTGLTKSALLRHLIRSSKYLSIASKLENHNNLISSFLNEIHKIGINLNQIAYHLNIDITAEEESKEKLANELAQVKILLKDYENKAFKNILDIAPKKFKTIKAENE